MTRAKRGLIAGPRDFDTALYATLVGDRDLSAEELLALMVQEPTLLRRPLAVRGEQAAIGFDRAGLTALAEDKP